MAPNLKTRKPVDELTEEDLSAFRIWEYADDEEGAYDETYVRPKRLDVVPRDVCVEVAAKYWLNSGADYLGIARVVTMSDEPEISPSFILFGPKTVGMPRQRERIPDINLGIDLVRENLPQALQLPMSDILPAKYQLLVILDGESAFREGIVK